jgi:hypothetical protein
MIIGVKKYKRAGEKCMAEYDNIGLKSTKVQVRNA